MKASEYYYQQMNKYQRQVYVEIREGILSLAPSFSVLKLHPKEISDIFFQVRLDHPEIFWAVDFALRSYQDATHMEMIPEYMFDKKKVKEHQTAMEGRISRLVRQAKDLNEKEKELFVHDFICRNVTYDKLKKPYSHEIIGPLGHGVGVCEGIAKTVKNLCDRLDIWCVIALSDAAPDRGIKYRHTWNVLKIGGQYYHMDATFDNSVGTPDLIRYDYLNLDDDRFFKDHEPVIMKIPACEDNKHSYYQEKKLSFTKVEEVAKRSAQAAKKGRPFIFHWRGGYLGQEILMDLVCAIHVEADKKGKFARIYVNRPQAVFQILYENLKDEPEKENDEKLLVEQEANEGEQEQNITAKSAQASN